MTFQAASISALLMGGFLIASECPSAAQGQAGGSSLVLKALPVEDEVESENDKPSSKGTQLDATWQTLTQARTLTLSIPAPRGQIVDRNGTPLAQNRVANYLALNFPFIKDPTPEKILNYAQEKIASANAKLGTQWSMDQSKLLSHYEHRRWLPLVFSVEEGLNRELTDEELAKIKPLLGSGLVIQPAYIRYYPKGDTACHMIGYVGKTRPLPVGPIADGDPLFEELDGREGLEASFDSDLQGTPGSVNMLFSPDGKLLSEEILRRPIPGRNVVTTIDYHFQRYAENALKKGARNGGSYVIMDVRNGDILAMASNPGYDLNVWVPGIKSADFQKLNTNTLKPLISRASSGQYPPASTFKIVTAIGALESGKVTERTSFNCSPSFLVGDRYFHNHTKNPEGPMNVITAIKRSCNTWFYQAALTAGADSLTSVAERMGFGERVGVPLAEAPGNLPTNAKKAEMGRPRIGGGELANMSIGQGEVLATPLQVCQAMAALADGTNLIQPRLVKQVQDISGRVIMANDVKFRRRVDIDPSHRQAVINGMIAVVSGSGGTGRAAGIKQAQVAGKTGTAQWRVAENRNLAWFTGFLPANSPVYAFAVLYEGRSGEAVSGGRLAAPMVSEVFKNIFEGASPDDPLVLAMKDTPRAIEVDEGEIERSSDGSAPAASRAPMAQVAEPPPPEPEKRGFFRRLFGNRR